MPTKVSSSLINTISASQIVATGATAGQVLTYNGSTSTWVASAALGASGLDTNIDTCVFNGGNSSTTTYTGTWSRGASNTTITINNHGLLTNHRLWLDFNATITDSLQTITVVDANTFTIPVVGAAASGTVSFKMCSVSSISSGIVGVNYVGTGGYSLLLRDNIATTASILITPSSRALDNSSAGYIPVLDAINSTTLDARTVNSLRFGTETDAGTFDDAGQYVSIAVI